MYTDIAACLPYASHVHVRDHFGSTGRLVDLERVWQMFAKSGYRGYMSAEYEGEEDACDRRAKTARQGEIAMPQIFERRIAVN